jgi:hypothetical protein
MELFKQLRGEAEPSAKRRKKRSRKKNALLAHPAILPILAVWGAAMLGGIVAVLPAQVIDGFAQSLGLAVPTFTARFAFAFLAALIGAGIAYGVGVGLRARGGKRRRKSAFRASSKPKEIALINPAQDLGSDSLDAPLEIVEAEEASETSAPAEQEGPRQPTLGELAERNFEMEPVVTEEVEDGPSPVFTRKHFKAALIESCEGATCEAADTEEAQGKPREMELAEFAALENRNAVWVEEPGAEPAPKIPDAPASKLVEAPPSALDKLRATPPEDLSLVQMVERFAAALHERQERERAHPIAMGQPRDAALAEALKALTLFTEGGLDKAKSRSGPDGTDIGETERELRDALAKLQGLRGAA